MNLTNRRAFLRTTATATFAAGLMPSLGRVLGANDAIRVAVVGFGGRGTSHIEAFSTLPGSRLVALCDADRTILDAGAKRLADKGNPVRTYTDVRRLLEDKEVDAISTATPNHWHSLIVVWSCQAGKDVYVEKPVSHNVFEGRQAVAAARQYKRIVQTGTQSRSNEGFREAIAWVRAGNLGKIRVARGLCYKRRASIGKVSGPQPIPAGIDYELWCGPALKLPLMRQRLHYDWHWVWNTGNGDIGNQGIHQMDIARWALGKNALSPRILSVGGRFGYIDDGETPNTQFAIHDYGDALLIFEVRGLPSGAPEPTAAAEKGEKVREEMDKYRGQSIGNVIECDHGYLSGTTAFDLDGKEIRKFAARGEENHFANFLKAVRSRNAKELNAEILEGHLSSALCHTSNISHRVGHKARPEEVREAIKAQPAAVETFERFQAHLARHKVDLNLDQATLGAFLHMDPKKERFIGNPAANELITRPYRAPFVVPEKV